MRKNASSCKWWNLTVIFTLLMVIALSPLVVNAQFQRDVYVATGKVVAEGANTVSTGKLGVRTFRLEEVDLPKKGDKTKVDRTQSGESPQPPDKVLRLIITGERLFNGAFIIWIDDEPVENVSSGPDLIAVIYDRSVLQDGATLAVSRHGRPYERTVLPERLIVPPHLQVRRLSPDELGNFITGIRRVVLQGQPYIEIELISGVGYPIMNNGLVLQIGREEFVAGADGPERRTVISNLTPEQFALLKNGDRVILKWYGALSGASFGVLDKSLLAKK